MASKQKPEPQAEQTEQPEAEAKAAPVSSGGAKVEAQRQRDEAGARVASARERETEATAAVGRALLAKPAVPVSELVEELVAAGHGEQHVRKAIAAIRGSGEAKVDMRAASGPARGQLSPLQARRVARDVASGRAAVPEVEAGRATIVDARKGPGKTRLERAQEARERARVGG